MKNSSTQGVLVGWLRQAVVIVIGIALMPFVVRLLGDQSDGQWALLSTVGCFYSLLCLGYATAKSKAQFSNVNPLRLYSLPSVFASLYDTTGGV